MSAETSTFQPMPPLPEDQLAALVVDIDAHGILVPIVVDQHGRILDGHNRAAIAAELGIECPKIVHEVADDGAAMDAAVSLNCARRHLNQEQRRELIRHELIRRPDDSDRAVARRVGGSPTTVGTVRADLRAEAEESTRRAREALEQGRHSLVMAAVMMHRGITDHGDNGPMSWQSVGDVLERTVLVRFRPGLDSIAELDQEAGDYFAAMIGGWFDSIRAWALEDCEPDCQTCTPEDREWAEQHPQQVWRHGDPPAEVSNLDTREPVGGSR